MGHKMHVIYITKNDIFYFFTFFCVFLLNILFFYNFDRFAFFFFNFFDEFFLSIFYFYDFLPSFNDIFLNGVESSEELQEQRANAPGGANGFPFQRRIEFIQVNFDAELRV